MHKCACLHVLSVYMIMCALCLCVSVSESLSMYVYLHALSQPYKHP